MCTFKFVEKTKNIFDMFKVDGIELFCEYFRINKKRSLFCYAYIRLFLILDSGLNYKASPHIGYFSLSNAFRCY